MNTYWLHELMWVIICIIMVHVSWHLPVTNRVTRICKMMMIFLAGFVCGKTLVNVIILVALHK